MGMKIHKRSASRNIHPNNQRKSVCRPLCRTQTHFGRGNEKKNSSCFTSNRNPVKKSVIVCLLTGVLCTMVDDGSR
jgi:hypothetical protein